VGRSWVNLPTRVGGLRRGWLGGAVFAEGRGGPWCGGGWQKVAVLGLRSRVSSLARVSPLVMVTGREAWKASFLRLGVEGRGGEEGPRKSEGQIGASIWDYANPAEHFAYCSGTRRRATVPAEGLASGHAALGRRELLGLAFPLVAQRSEIFVGA